MTRRSKITAGIAIAVAGLTVLAILAAILVMRSTWFGSYVREKIIVAVEDSTGGKVDLASFSFDWHTLTATARGFVIHGTEPPGSPPLFSAPLIVLKLKLITTFEHMVDLESLEVDTPSANVMIFENGDSNLPAPKVARDSSAQSGLERVIDLAIHRLDISSGTIQFQARRIAFSAHGDNLRIEWLYDPSAVEYRGTIAMTPLHLATGSNPPLDVQLTLPLVISKNSIRTTNATLSSTQSKIMVSGQIRNLAAPDVASEMTAHLALSEFARSFALPLDTSPNQAMEVHVALHSDPKTLEIQTASIGLGASHLELAGNLRTGADVHAVLSLREISALLRAPQHPEGAIEIAGNASYKDSKYEIDGKLDASGIAIKEIPSRLAFTSAFRIDPATIAMSDLNLSALGGRITGAAELRDLKTINASLALHDFTLHGLASTLANKQIAYGGAISGTIEARGDLKSPDAHARIVIAPQSSGVPVSGILDARYTGSTGILALENSRLTLPHTQIDLSGETGHQAEIRAISRNLNDFHPLLALVSSSSMPVALNGGEARFDAQVRGPLAKPSISGNVSLTRFSVSNRPFDRLSANFLASPNAASVTDGIISHNSSAARFSASAGLHDWSPEPQQTLSAAITIRNADLADAVALAGENPAGTRGQLIADVNISGTLGNPQGVVRAAATDGTIRNEHFDRIALNATLSDQQIILQSIEAAAGQANLNASGTFTHPRDSLEDGRITLHVASSQIPLDQFKTLQLGGTVNLSADLISDLQKMKLALRSVNANLKAAGIRDHDQNYGDLTATATTQGSAVHSNIASNFAGSSIQWTGVTQLADPYPTTAQGSIQALPIEKLLAAAHQESVAAKGILSANAHLSGTLRDPHAAVDFELTRAHIFDEPIDRARGSVEYSNALITISALEISEPGGRADLHGSFAHAASSYDSGKLDLHVTTSSVQLQRIHLVDQWKPGLHGAAQFTADVTGQLEIRNGKRELLPSRFAATASLDNLSIDNHPLGSVKLATSTSGNGLDVKLDSDLGKSAIHGNATIALSGDYAAQGKLNFANVTYTGLDGLIDFGSLPEGFEAAAAGEADFSGPLLQPAALSGKLQIDKLEFSSTKSIGGKRIALQNDGPLSAHLDRSAIHIDSARFAGPSTHLELAGSAGFSTTSPIELTVNGNADLSLVKQLYQGAFSGGTVTLASTIRGSIDQPLINGQVQFNKASLQMESWPNGIYNANGTVLLNGRTASIQSLTAESGGGKLSANGFIGFAGAALNYDLHADAQGVRVRSSGASIVADSSVNLSGTSTRSVIAGSVTVNRFAYSQSSDLGSILSGSGSVPPSQPGGAGFLSDTRLNIRVQTAPGLQFQTSAAQQLSATADLTVVGTLASPGMVGRITVTDGNLLFFGNKYTVNRGTISFYDALAIQPILDIDLQTLVQGVTVEISASGPIQNLKLTYHSDPPLRFEDIVALLASGRTPPDPTIASQQPPAPDQTATQMGESALLGQAIASPVASRLQRVFGVSQFKIAPEFVTGSSIPQARVTLQQQISPTVTFTYSQDLSQTNSQLVRVEWDLTARFSAVATRDENGIFGVDFFYRKQFK